MFLRQPNNMLIVYFRFGFFGNQPRSTRFFCSKSSPMPQRAEAPNTPTMADRMAFSMNRAPMMDARPITR